MLYLTHKSSPTIWKGMVRESFLNGSILTLRPRYYLQYHPYFPIAPAADILLQSSELPVLFWVVMLISSMYDPKTTSFPSALMDEVKALISITHAPSNQPLRLTQALLLLCCWPFPFGPSVHDSSWIYCGLAITCAHTQGFHRADHPSDFTYGANISPEEITERKITWIACFITSQR